VFAELNRGARALSVCLSCGRSAFSQEQREIAQGVDIVIATPGRLLEHMKTTSGFATSLSSLRFLVVDDADRLLQQAYHNWVGVLVRAVDPLAQSLDAARASAGGAGSIPRPPPAGLDLCSWVGVGGGSVAGAAAAGIGWLATDGGSGRDGPKKIVLSATLTRNPAKLSSLKLHNPRSFHAAGGEAGGAASKYLLPPTLMEMAWVPPQGLKPLALVELLRKEGRDGVTLVFCNSVDAVHRLSRLLQLVGGMRVAEFSSKLTQQQRAAVVERAGARSVDVVVCSDAMTRGMDIETVSLVVNYDAPSTAKVSACPLCCCSRCLPASSEHCS